MTSFEPSSSYGYAQARQTLQWLVSARAMWRQAEKEQAVPDPARLKALAKEIEELLFMWSHLDPNDTAAFARIEQVYAPEVKEIFALLEADGGSAQ